MIQLKRAIKEDAETIRLINIETFNDEMNRVAGRDGGPPGYDDIEEQLHLIEHYIVYLIMKGETIIGSFFLEDQSEQVNQKRHTMRLENFAILPKYQGQGFGYETMQVIEKTYPSVVKWTLSALKVSIRSQKLYEKVGYKKVSDSDFLFEYEKCM